MLWFICFKVHWCIIEWESFKYVSTIKASFELEVWILLFYKNDHNMNSNEVCWSTKLVHFTWGLRQAQVPDVLFLDYVRWTMVICLLVCLHARFSLPHIDHDVLGLGEGACLAVKVLTDFSTWKLSFPLGEETVTIQKSPHWDLNHFSYNS